MQLSLPQAWSIKSSAFIGGRYTDIEIPSKSAAPELTLSSNFIVHNSPGTNITKDNGFIYAVENGEVIKSKIIAYMGKRPPASDGVYEFPAKKDDIALTEIAMTLKWAGAKKIIIPSTVTSIAKSAFDKTNNANQNLTVILNKTGREFDWYELTGSTKTNPGKFVTGLVLHQSGNIEIVDK